MKAVLWAEPFTDPGWIYERKLDGVRWLAHRHRGSPRAGLAPGRAHRLRASPRAGLALARAHRHLRPPRAELATGRAHRHAGSPRAGLALARAHGQDGSPAGVTINSRSSTPGGWRRAKSTVAATSSGRFIRWPGAGLNRSGRPSKNDFSRRLRLTVAVARGKI